MDPLSQGLVGAVLPGSVSGKKEVRLASLVGFLSGMLADVDILIRSPEDPLLVLDYHRQFTHSLVFIPLGGLIAAGILRIFLGKRLGFAKLYLYATLGYATAGLLDACTNYGTQLLWPFSDERIAWNIISIIDPVFTLILAFFVIFAVIRRSRAASRIGLLFAVLYLAFGLYQRERAEDVLRAVAEERGHAVERALVFPSIGNLVLWRAVYESGGKYYMNAVRVGLFSPPKIYEGGQIEKFDPERDLPDLDPESVLYRDVRRFEHFSDGYLAVYPDSSNAVGDMRYSLLPGGVKPLWGIVIDEENPGSHITMYDYGRDVTDEKWRVFLAMIRGQELERGTSEEDE